MKQHILIAGAIILLATICHAGDCDNPPTPGECEKLDEHCNIVPAKDCWELEEHGEDSDPASCPSCEAAYGMFASCPNKVKEVKYYVPVEACSGFESYTTKIIDWQTHVICDVGYNWTAILAWADSVGECSLTCYTAAGSMDPSDIAECIDCVIDAGKSIPDFDFCDYIECDESATVFVVPTWSAEGAGGSCP